jgi:hypothetical protein
VRSCRGAALLPLGGYVRPTRVTGIVMRADLPGSLSVQRYDDDSAVMLSRVEANLTNYRLIVGDEMSFRLYHGGDGRWRALDVTLLKIGGSISLLSVPLTEFVARKDTAGIVPAQKRTELVVSDDVQPGSLDRAQRTISAVDPAAN